jgi:hypothetical protein
MICRGVSAFLVAFIAGTSAAVASSTAAWEMNTFQDFMRGRFTGLSLSRDGRISLAPRLDVLFSSDQPSIWAVAQASDRTLYVGTGHRGRLYRVEPNGASSLLWTAQQPEIFAVATGPDGAVYAGTSPDGKVYRISNGTAAEYFAPGARYIWALSFGSDGALYVATGDQGKIFRVTAAGAGELYYDTGQNHVTCLLAEPNGHLLAGTEPNGILYRISAKDKAFVLYDANLPEIRAVDIAPDGAIYAAALGGSIAQKTSGTSSGVQTSSGTAPVTAPTTTITVTDEAQAGMDIKPKPPDGSKQQGAATTLTPGATVYTATPDAYAGLEKSALYKINPDNTVETLWTSREENIYDVLAASAYVLFSTDAQGRIYRLNPDRRVTLVIQTNEAETTRLIAAGDALLAATGSMGKVYRIGGGLAASGTYESPVHDAGAVARWGQLTWKGERAGNAGLVFRTRSGNSARPDRTWSDWSEPATNPSNASVSSPNARFVQWRAEMIADGAVTPSLSGVTLSYLPQNNPPVIRSLNVATQLAALAGAGKTAAQQPASASYSITVTDTGELAPSSSSGTPTQTVSRGVSQQIQISWHADDPDGDRLVYALYFRGEEESQWKLLRSNFSETSLVLEGDVFADGKYLFRLVTSDKPSNAAAAAREADLTSAPVLFDNTPPAVTSGPPRRNGGTVELDVEAVDSSSGLRRAEYSLDATAWIPLEAIDGVVDGRQERFRLRLENLPPGEHLIVIRAFDSSNNAGLTKVIVP